MAHNHTQDLEQDSQSTTAMHRVAVQPMFEGPGLACSSVLCIPELLENILFFLPAKRIFSAQRVCQAWKDTVTRSIPIQEKLFFRCQSKPQEVWKLYCRKHGLNLSQGYPNGRTYQYLPMSQFSGEHHVQLQCTEPVQDAIQMVLPVALNPALEAPTSITHRICRQQAPLLYPLLKVDHEGMFLSLPDDILAYEEYELFQLVAYTGTMTTLEHIAATYVSDPPCQYASLDVRVSYDITMHSLETGRIGATLRFIYIHSSTGLKMADLLDALSQQRCLSYSFEMPSPELFPADRDWGLGWDDDLGDEVTVVELQ
jgi:hypothetical protein